ncbi:MAG: GNAT family N-acetyltransferase [Isosphaeraceae bacterium]
MTPDDLPLGLRLSQQAGWNQIASDWVRFLSLQPDGCFVAERNTQPIATVTTCLFGTVGWIAMMLVEREARGQGIGRALMTRALEFLENQGARTVRLDATHLGQPLYERLGFVGDYALTRFLGRPPATETPSTTTSSFTPSLARRLHDLDRLATGTDRSRLLNHLAQAHPDNVHVTSSEPEGIKPVEGFLMARPGANAFQVGPCIAREESGPRLLADALQGLRNQTVLIDIPRDQLHAVELVHARGLAPQRDFLRMSRGGKVQEIPGLLWASSGPEMG